MNVGHAKPTNTSTTQTLHLKLREHGGGIIRIRGLVFSIYDRKAVVMKSQKYDQSKQYLYNGMPTGLIPR